MSFSIPSVVTIAGSDSSGGAGIQADIKTIESMGLFAQTAITALTAQNTTGVLGVFDVPAEFVSAQIDAVFSDIRPAAVKIGMVSSASIVDTIAERLLFFGAENIVVDPVMVATSGSPLISDGAREVVAERLFPLARLITPNIPEAQILSGRAIAGKLDMERAALDISKRCSSAVLVKGGHGVEDADDVLAVDGDVCWIEARRIENSNTHGTGCTLSSAIACGLAKGEGVLQACSNAKNYISGALESGLDLGKKSGPLDHMWQFRDKIEPITE